MGKYANRPGRRAARGVVHETAARRGWNITYQSDMRHLRNDQTGLTRHEQGFGEGLYAGDNADISFGVPAVGRVAARAIAQYCPGVKQDRPLRPAPRIALHPEKS